MTDEAPLLLVLGIVTGVIAVARVVRLVVDDTWPPMIKAKGWYIERASMQWLGLVECPFCVAPYVAAPAVAWFATLVAWPHATWNLWLWWVVNAWAAVSYVAAMVTVRDLPPEARE